VIEEGFREGEVTSSNPTGCEEHDFCAKNTVTCDGAGGGQSLLQINTCGLTSLFECVKKNWFSSQERLDIDG
jgi:hypothetical protein